MLVCNFLDDRQPKTGSLDLGCDIGLEGTLKNLVREAASTIQHAQADAPSRAQILGAQHDAAIFRARRLTRLAGVLRILKQVMNDLAQLLRIPHHLGARHIQLGTKKDFTKLKSEIKIPFATEMKENDTLHVVLTPTRADFRKLLRKEGFEYESNYLFK